MRKTTVIIYPTMKLSVLAGVILTALLLTGCKGKEDESSPPANPSGPTAAAPTSTEMPPEVKARMDKTQADMKARADGQGNAMMSGKMAPGK